MIDPSRVQPEFVGDLVWLRNARGVGRIEDDNTLIVQVANDGYRITVPDSAIAGVSTVWRVGGEPGSLAVEREWWDAQVSEAKPNGLSHPSEAIAEAIASRNGGVEANGRDVPVAVEPAPSSTAALIVLECDRIEKLLLAKNRAYGDSALAPVRLLSKANPQEGIAVRADDKLSRIINAGGLLSCRDDDLTDLIGYLILLCVARKAAR